MTTTPPLTAAGLPARPGRPSRATQPRKARPMPRKPKSSQPTSPTSSAPASQPPAPTGTDCKVSWQDPHTGTWTRCDKTARAEGYCPTHYKRWLRGREKGLAEADLLAYVHTPLRARGTSPQERVTVALKADVAKGLIALAKARGTTLRLLLARLGEDELARSREGGGPGNKK